MTVFSEEARTYEVMFRFDFMTNTLQGAHLVQAIVILRDGEVDPSLTRYGPAIPIGAGPAVDGEDGDEVPAFQREALVAITDQINAASLARVTRLENQVRVLEDRLAQAGPPQDAVIST